jgi:DNA-binding PadR family transcriptional regulator
MVPRSGKLVNSLVRPLSSAIPNLVIMSNLEEAGYIEVKKEFKGKKPHTVLHLTQERRAAFREYQQRMKQVLDDLPD